MTKTAPEPETPPNDLVRDEDRALRAILEGTARATGTEFFRALVTQLGEVLKVRYCMVTELLAEELSLRSLAFWDQGELRENFTYSVKGTPCEGVIYGEICHYPSQLQEAFPDDDYLVQMGAVSYFGVPFVDNDKRVIGHLGVLDTKPMPADPRARTILEIFAARAAAELVSIRAEDARAASEANFRQLTEGIQEVFWLVRAADLRILYISPAFERIWGRERQGLFDDPYAWTNTIHPADRDRVIKAYDETAGAFDEEYRIIRPDGTIRWIRDRGFPIRDKNGEVYRVAGIAADITKQKIDLTGKLLSAQEDERRRLARELHDDLTQRLAMLALEAGTVEKQCRTISPEACDRLQRMREQIAQLSRDVHGISRRLHPAILDDLGLVEAIRSQCNAFEDHESIPVEFNAENVPDQVYEDVAFCYYRITQESLRNIAKHAKADSVRVSLFSKGDRLELAIEDRGVGFDPQRREPLGLGLASMAERVRMVHGTLDVHSEPGHGTRIRVATPLTRRAG